MTLPILSGAVTRTSSVWPARKRERERLIDRRTFTRPPAGAVTVLRLTGQRRPEQRNSTFRPGLALVISSRSTRTREPVTCQLVETLATIGGSASRMPSQFSSTALPGISTAPGRIAGSRSLQSWAAGNPSPSASGGGGGAVSQRGAPSRNPVVYVLR